MTRRNFLSLALGAAALVAIPAVAAIALPRVEVFKSSNCECCGAWVEHMKAGGFDVKVTLVNASLRSRSRSCRQ